MLKLTEDKDAYWTPEEIDAKLENDWDGLDQPSLVSFVQDDILIKLEKLGYVKLANDQTLPEIPSFVYDSEDDRKLLQRGAINYSKLLSCWRKVSV